MVKIDPESSRWWEVIPRARVWRGPPDLVPPETRKYIEASLEERRRLMERYGPLWGQVEEVLYRLDPYGLISLLGDRASSDEYTWEVQTILRKIETVNSPADVRRLVEAVFREAFGASETFGNLDGAAGEIWRLWTDHNNAR